MAEDVERCRHHAFIRAQADAHEDIANLRDGGERNHPANVGLTNGGNAAHHHADKRENEQHILNPGGDNDVQPNYAVHNLHQQEDVALADQGGQHRGGRRGRIGVGIRHPCVEREEGALDGQTDGNQRDDNRQRHLILPGLRQCRNRFLHVAHQQVTRQVIQQDDAQQEKT